MLLVKKKVCSVAGGGSFSYFFFAGGLFYNLSVHQRWTGNTVEGFIHIIKENYCGLLKFYVNNMAG